MSCGLKTQGKFMSIDANVLSMLPSSANAENASRAADSALANWKGASSAWNQETADAAGKASVNYAVQWNAAVMPAIDEEISRFNAEYEEKKSKYDAAKAQYDAASKNVKQAQADMDACMDYPKPKGYTNSLLDNGGYTGAGAGMPQKKVIVNYRGYNDAKSREAQALSEQNRYSAEMKSWKKQMDSAKAQASSAEKKKSQERTKIEKFIMDVYALNLMNESVEFLHALRSSSVEISKPNQNKLYSRLFLIENKYRKQFEMFAKIIEASKEKYKKTNFSQSQESLDFFAERAVKAKKFKSIIRILLFSNSIDSAELSFKGKQEFIVSKDKIQAALENAQAECKDYSVQADRSNLKIELNKVYVNDEILNEIETIESRSDEYKAECEKLLDILLENGATANKLKILWGKIGNKFVHAKENREAYKKMSPEERVAAKAEKKRLRQEKRAAAHSEKEKRTPRESTVEKKKKSLVMLLVLLAVFILIMFIMMKALINM